MATKVQPAYYDDEFTNSNQQQTEIILERREEVGRVQLGQGPGSAITESFRMAGEYISEKLGPGNDGNISIEFSLNGMNFIARVES